MAIQDRNLTPGTRLVATYKKEVFHALVVEGPDGKVRYQLVPYDGKEYKSPSSLGTAVTGKSCNGWSFWSVDTSSTETSGETPSAQETAADEGNAGQESGDADAQADPTSEEEDSQTEPSDVEPEPEFPEPTDRPRFHRVPNQKNVDPGQVRLHCYTCRSSFIVPDDRQPDTCPMGHEPV
jgi:hypothetical protein